MVNRALDWTLYTSFLFCHVPWLPSERCRNVGSSDG